MPPDSTNIESDNYLKRYMRRPNAMSSCCLADYVSKYNIILPKKSSESKVNTETEVLPEEEDDIDNIHTEDLNTFDDNKADETINSC